MSEPLAVREVPARYQVVRESQRLRPRYTQTEVGVIPEDWKQTTIGAVAEKVGSGMTPRGGSSKYKEYGRPFVRSQNIGWGRLLLGDIAYIDDETHSTFSATELKENDVLLNITGASIGRSALASQQLVGGNVNQHVCIIRSNPNGANPGFINYLLLSSLGQRQIDSFQAGGNREGLNFGQIRSIKLPLPPTKAEQEAIAEALSDADALIESLEQLIAKKRHLKQGAMQELLTGKKRLPGFSGEWEVKRLGDVIEKIVGGGTPSRSNPQYWGNEIPWVTVKDFATFDPRSAQEAITKTGLQHSASHLIPKDTLITSTRMALGKAVIYEVDVAINQDLKALFPKSVLATQFLYFWFQYHGQSIDELGSGSTVKGISLPDLKKIEFPLPLIPEQTAIATVLSDMDADLTAMEQQRDKTRALKQGMMQELLTGRIRLV